MPLGLGLGISKLKSLISGLRVRFQGNATITAALDGILRDLSADFVSNGTVTAALEAIKLLDVDFSGEGTLNAELGGYTPAQDPDLFEWWDAQSGVSESGGELTAWVGSVNSETANPPTVTSRPLYGSDQINSLDVLSFRSADPNYLELDASSLSSGCCIHLIMNIESETYNYFLGRELSTDQRLRFRQGNNGAADQNLGFGGNINYYINNVLEGNNITGDELYNALTSGACVLTLDNIDLSNVATLRIAAVTGLSTSYNAILGDVIISDSNGKRSENAQYLVDKYGF